MHRSTRFKEYHNWLLLVYEKLYEGSLSKLINCGLVNHVCDILRDELEHCDYDSLRRKISSFDDGKCTVHLAGSGTCPFAPLYRSTSPTYQQIQEDMKSTAYISDYNYNFHQQARGEDSLSPCSSPAHSWSSGSSSPCHSGISIASYSSFSEDEGCYSSCPTPQKRLRSASPGELPKPKPSVINSSPEEIDRDVDENGPVLKKLKLEDGSSSSSDSKNGTKTRCDKSLYALKSSGKKIVNVLNILHKCSHITPFPDDMLEILPILLGIIVRGKVSLMPQRAQYEVVESDDEFRDLSRRTFEVSYKIILKMCSIIQIFPEMVVSGIIPVLHRLQEPMPITTLNTEAQAGVVQEYCSNLITRMVGLENDTAGWREGFIMRTLLVNNSAISPNKMDQMVLNIPLLYEKHPAILRKFEMKAKSWSKILEMLVNSDDTSFYSFEDCSLALCSICNAIGVKWQALDAGKSVPTLLNVPSGESDAYKIVCTDDVITTRNNTGNVLVGLDDGNTLLVTKDLLVNASPVFAAMFNGSFVEGFEQKVNLSNVSLNAACLLLNQLYLQGQATNLSSSTDNNCHIQYDLSIIFEIFSLADRFLLDEIYERALNTLITKYICPNSAPMIYGESVKLLNLQKSSNRRQTLGDSNLNLFILKYILTAKGVRMSERCSAIRKVFETVMPDHVVRDLKLLIEHNMYKS